MLEIVLSEYSSLSEFSGECLVMSVIVMESGSDDGDLGSAGSISSLIPLDLIR